MGGVSPTTPTEPTPADPLGLAAQVKHFAAANARLAAELEQSRAENARLRQQRDATKEALKEALKSSAGAQALIDAHAHEVQLICDALGILVPETADPILAAIAAPPVLARDTRVLLDADDRRWVVAGVDEWSGRGGPDGTRYVRLMPEQLPEPDVDELVDTPAGRRWLAGAPAREANRPTPAVNARARRILEQLAPAAIWSDEDLFKVVYAARGAGAVQDYLRDGLVERCIPAGGDAVDAALAEIDRLRVRVHEAVDETQRRYATMQSKYETMLAFSREAMERHNAEMAAKGNPPGVEINGYGLATAAAIIGERDTAEQRVRDLELELGDLRYNLALRAFCAPDMDAAAMFDSFDARLRDSSQRLRDLEQQVVEALEHAQREAANAAIARQERDRARAANVDVSQAWDADQKALAALRAGAQHIAAQLYRAADYEPLGSYMGRKLGYYRDKAFALVRDPAAFVADMDDATPEAKGALLAADTTPATTPDGSQS